MFSDYFELGIGLGNWKYFFSINRNIFLIFVYVVWGEVVNRIFMEVIKVLFLLLGGEGDV